MSVKVDKLLKRHKGVAAAAIKDLSFTVEPGQTAAIVGRSGAGKSTLLRCLVGLDPFDGGAIEIDQVRIDAAEVAGNWQQALATIRGRIGMVFQSFELFPHLTVLQNCMLGPIRVRGVKPEAAEARARELLKELGLADKADAFPDRLSGGQKQRVAIARALCMEPKVLLYDEPTSALDPSLRNEVLSTLVRVRKSGMTQLVVTHDVGLARDVADLVLVLHAGELVEFGPPAEVLKNPQHEATKKLVEG